MRSDITRQQLKLDASLRPACLNGLRDVRDWVHRPHIHRHREAIGQTGLCQQRFTLGKIELVRLIGDGAEKSLWQE